MIGAAKSDDQTIATVGVRPASGPAKSPAGTKPDVLGVCDGLQVAGFVDRFVLGVTAAVMTG